MSLVQGQTSGDTNSTPQTTGASYALIYDPATDGLADAIEISNDSGTATDSVLIKAERWAGASGTPGEHELYAGEVDVVRGRSTVEGAARIIGKIWAKNGSASCAIRWKPI